VEQLQLAKEVAGCGRVYKAVGEAEKAVVAELVAGLVEEGLQVLVAAWEGVVVRVEGVVLPWGLALVVLRQPLLGEVG